MFTLFKKAGPRRQAILAGTLLDMDKRPYSKINRVLGIPFALAITPAAFEKFVALGKTPAHRELLKPIRWGNILAALLGIQPPPDVPETIFEVRVVEPDGTLREKPIKVSAGADDDGRGAFTFMLPEEVNPFSSEV